MSDYAVPTTAEVEAAVRRLTTYQLRRVFYEGLKNPNWVKPLADLNVFTNPPEPEATGDGYIKDVFWPEVSYLLNVAEEAPSQVIDVLLSLESTANSWVRRAAFVIGAKVPADQAARLKPLVQAWTEAGGLGWRTDPRDLVSFAVNLLEGGQKYGITFANTLFRPRDAEDDARDPVVELKAYWYSHELPRVANALGSNGLKTVLPWLTQYERIKKSVSDTFDHSGFSRSTVATRGDGHRDIEDALIDCVRDLAKRDFGTDPDTTWRLFEKNEILIAQRIAMYSMAHALEEAADPHLVRKLVSMGGDLLAKPLCRDQGARLEFVALAKALVARSAADVLVEVINEGHFTADSSARIRKNMADRGESSESIDESLQRWDETWRHQVLAGIGRDHLPPVLQAQLDDLDASRGVIERPLAPAFEMTSWTGPNSPLDQDAMAAMSPTELLAHLESWHDSGDRWTAEPSHEGQGRVLSAVLTANPLALGDATGFAERLRPTYIRAVLSGWEAAFKADLDLPWGAVVAAVSYVVSHGYASDFPVEGGRLDDDADFRGAKQAAVGILEEFAKVKSSDRIPADALRQIASLLIETSEDEVAWNDYANYESSNESGMDPLTTSLNWQWPNMVRGLLHLVTHGPAASWYASAAESLERELGRQDPRGASRAVVGEALGRLHDRAPEWLDMHFETYFGSEASLDRGQQIALTTAIAMHYYHPALYRRLSGSMIAALGEADEIAVGWGDQDTPKARIGQWVVQAVIRGHIDHADPLRVAFYSVAPADVRGDAIGHVAWSFLRADKVDDVFRDRLAELWDERAAHVAGHPEDSAELMDFYWFVTCGKFGADWWLTRLKQAISLDPELETHGMIGEQLAEAAPAHPQDALEVLRLLLKPAETHHRDHWDLTHHALAPVLAAAMDAGDDQLTQDAIALMNEMGERGEVDLDQRVAALRATEAP
ncbi:hypothetical protein EK0264_04085 [Epidermidibacterium keratini]|uniref:Uncharacterized protein n=1 Tax=Epidermidibacterium keratini TaxID=1891644 RepID=A0A7L4YL30_9ACTN|nr:hypothetical protein [Epidermidibacterium keratini]QHB99543.1 hypothetical protein EK0264_04085 [Epidermidibacterium keratini]